jgi:hypothetical protein
MNMDEYKGLKESSHLRHGVLILPVCQKNYNVIDFFTCTLNKIGYQDIINGLWWKFVAQYMRKT